MTTGRLAPPSPWRAFARFLLPAALLLAQACYKTVTGSSRVIEVGESEPTGRYEAGIDAAAYAVLDPGTLMLEVRTEAGRRIEYRQQRERITQQCDQETSGFYWWYVVGGVVSVPGVMCLSSSVCDDPYDDADDWIGDTVGGVVLGVGTLAWAIPMFIDLQHGRDAPFDCVDAVTSPAEDELSYEDGGRQFVQEFMVRLQAPPDAGFPARRFDTVDGVARIPLRETFHRCPDLVAVARTDFVGLGLRDIEAFVRDVPVAVEVIEESSSSRAQIDVPMLWVREYLAERAEESARPPAVSSDDVRWRLTFEDRRSGEPVEQVAVKVTAGPNEANPYASEPGPPQHYFDQSIYDLAVALGRKLPCDDAGNLFLELLEQVAAAHPERLVSSEDGCPVCWTGDGGCQATSTSRGAVNACVAVAAQPGSRLHFEISRSGYRTVMVGADVAETGPTFDGADVRAIESDGPDAFVVSMVASDHR